MMIIIHCNSANHAYPADRAAARADGAEVYLVKPYTAAALDDAIVRFADCSPPPGVAATENGGIA